MAGGTMKTSYYLVAAAGLAAAVVTIYGRLPLRAETPAATLPLPRDPAVVAPLPAVPDVPLPPIVPPPDAPLVIPAAGTPAPLPALPTTPTAAAIAQAPPLPTPSAPAIPPAPALAVPPASAVPITPAPSIPAIPATPTAPTAPKTAPHTAISPAVPPLTTPPAPVAPAPEPVKPTAPPEPEPLPLLPPPTPFDPKLDKPTHGPAAKLANTGKFIVLKGNKLINGSVMTNADKIIVRKGALDRTFDKADVLFVGDSRDDVYRFMLSKAPTDNMDTRLAVAKWCALNGLREQALTEARTILALQAGHRGAADLARSLEESLRHYPADESTTKPQVALVTVEEPEIDVTAEGATTFSSRAQPILANQCMECHARDDHNSGFRLKRVTGFEVGPHATHANLRAVAGQLKKDDPANSPLLIKALTTHGGMKQPAFVSRQAVAFRVLESWVMLAAGNGSIPPMTLPAQPVVPPTSAVTPIPPAMAEGPLPAPKTAPTASATTTPVSTPAPAPPALPPVEPKPVVVPPVLPTPPSIPVIEPHARTLPRLPEIPSAPAIPVSTPATTKSKAAGAVKPTSQFGTVPPKPRAPSGTDEFDAAAFNAGVPEKK